MTNENWEKIYYELYPVFLCDDCERFLFDIARCTCDIYCKSLDKINGNFVTMFIINALKELNEVIYIK